MRLAGAVDIGGSAVKLGIVASDGTIVERAKARTTPDGDPEPLVARIATTLLPMLDAARRGSPVEGVGVSVAGFLNGARDAMVGNANLPALCGFPLRRALEERLALACLLEVDSNAAAVAEYRHGAGRGSARQLSVTIGTGLGGGVIVGGALLRFTGGCAGDLGHIILDPKGPRCTCGGRGCFEALVCSAALSARDGGRPVRDVIARARQQEPSALDALATTGRWLGLGLASLSPAFAPDMIVVGGGVAAAGDLLLEPARASYREHAGSAFRDSARIVSSAFEGWDGIVGAASLFLDPLA